MGIVALVLGLGALLLIGSVILMWYVLIFALTLLVILSGLSYWITFFLVEHLTGDTDLAGVMGISVAVVVFLGLIYWGYKSEKWERKDDRS